mgnify:CR=1 FL=1
MKALMYRGVSPEGRGDFQLIDVPVPDCPPGSVELDVEWCGICGSDLHEFEADTMSTYATPVVIGHEFSGVVSRVGEGVDSVRVGQRVAVEPFLHCRECAACLAGDSHLCPSLAVVGAHHAGGGFAQKAVVPAYTLHALPDSIAPEVGALIEPLAVGWHALRKAHFTAGQSVLIIGAGPIGLASLLCAQAQDASLTLVSVRRPGARERAARELGADAVLDASSDDVLARVMELTDGRGVDVVLECSGATEGMELSMKALANGGVIVSLSVWLEPAPCDYLQLLLKEATIVGSKGYNGQDFPEVIEAVASGRIVAPERIITTRLALDDVITDGFMELERDRTAHVKVLVRP